MPKFERFNPRNPWDDEGPDEAEARDKLPPGNLLDNFDGAVEAVLEIEKQWSSTGEDPIRREALRSDMAMVRRTVLDEKRRSGFEGFGGFNRYEVDLDGAIRLSAYHSIGRCIEKAKELGIEVKGA